MSTKLGELVRPVRWSLGAAVLLDAVSALMVVVPFVAVVRIASALLEEGGRDEARKWAWIAVAALLLRAVTMFAAYAVTHLSEAELASDLRGRIVDHLSRLPLGWFGSRASGRVKKAAQDDVAALHHLVAHSALDTTTAVVVPVASLACLFWVDWRMALVALVPLVAALALYAVALGGSLELYRRYDASLAEINAATVEYAGGIAVVKAFGRTGSAHSTFDQACADFHAFFDRWMRRSARAGTAMEVISSPPVALLLLVLAAAGLVSTGTPALDVLPGIVLGLGICGPLLALAMGLQDLREASQAADRIGALLAVPALPVAADPVLPRGHEVVLDGVTFGYEDHDEPGAGTGDVLPADPGPAAVDDVSLELVPGTVTALVGLSGSGKSTLARLVPRFHDPRAGEVRLGGAPVHRVATGELYRHVSFVFQEDHLLVASLRENIALARPEATDHEVRRAARAARIDERIMALPDGYDCVLGRDVHLSGGERQRVAIARALLADAPVIVLDEATAFADPDCEDSIQQALSRLAAGRTVLVIAHRLHTVAHADRIVVLDAGRVVESGSHGELLALDGHYSRLWAASGAPHAPGHRTGREDHE